MLVEVKERWEQVQALFQHNIKVDLTTDQAKSLYVLRSFCYDKFGFSAKYDDEAKMISDGRWSYSTTPGNREATFHFKELNDVIEFKLFL